MTYDCIIIGAGPAGMIAALQMQRAGLNIVLFEKKEVGGLLRNANAVENYLGCKGKVSGKDLAKRFKEHLNEHKVELIREEVMEVGEENNAFLVKTNKNCYKCNNVIVATGTKPKRAGIEGEEGYAGKKVFYEICDMPEMDKKKEVLIIGGGDVGFDYALQLKEQGHEPTIITQRKIRCLPLLKKRTQEQRIRCIENSSPDRIEEEVMQFDYILIAVGREPHYPLITAQKSEGLYHVGDVKNGFYRQVHIATGDALRVAMDIIRTSLLTHDSRP